jgi:DNA-binding transcriptional ArsR family regulator
MGTTKTEEFTSNQNKKALVFKALGHPARIAIVEYLATVRSCICNDLIDILPLSQATISQHLRELKEAGIIQGTIEGNSRCYCLNVETFVKMKGILDFLISNSTQINCC